MPGAGFFMFTPDVLTLLVFYLILSDRSPVENQTSYFKVYPSGHGKILCSIFDIQWFDINFQLLFSLLLHHKLAFAHSTPIIVYNGQVYSFWPTGS